MNTDWLRGPNQVLKDGYSIFDHFLLISDKYVVYSSYIYPTSASFLTNFSHEYTTKLLIMKLFSSGNIPMTFRLNVRNKLYKDPRFKFFL